MSLGAAKMAQMQVFDFIQGKESFSGKVPWTKPIPQLVFH